MLNGATQSDLDFLSLNPPFIVATSKSHVANLSHHLVRDDEFGQMDASNASLCVLTRRKHTHTGSDCVIMRGYDSEGLFACKCIRAQGGICRDDVLMLHNDNAVSSPPVTMETVFSSAVYVCVCVQVCFS